MKIKILSAIILFPLFLLAQKSNENMLAIEVTDLRATILAERAKGDLLQARMQTFESRFQVLSDSLVAQLNSNFQFQAQNEKALNLALDEFSKKFEDQNKTVERVNKELQTHWNEQLLFYGIAILVFVLILLITVRVATKRALKKQTQTWNELNEYIIKR